MDSQAIYIRFLICILVFCIAFISCDTDSPDPEKFSDPGISKDLAEYRARVISNTRYTLDFAIPAQSNLPIEAKEEIRFQISDTTEHLLLDATDDINQIDNLVVNGKAAAVEHTNTHLTIPKELLTLGENEISFSFTAGDLSLNRREDFMYTLFVPARASSAFPCFDQPDLKAQFSLRLEIPIHWDAVANGRTISVNETDSLKQYEFGATKPISTYLFAFAAGEFQKIEHQIGNRKFVMFHRETDEKKLMRNTDDIFRLHEMSYDWLEEYTDIPYAYGDYEFLLIPSFQYGGMEHPGAIWYNASSLFLDESPGRNRELNRARLIGHEVAHMWFGNLVTMKWFDDVWLKEVFANFMADKITRPSFPEINHTLKFVNAHYPDAYDVDRSPGTHPIQQPLNNLAQAGSLYGSIIYKKAPIIMYHLEEMIGEEMMNLGLQKYLKQYSHGNATWDDLIQVLSETSNKELKHWNQVWVKSPGMPLYKIDVQKDKTDHPKSLKLLQVGKTAHQQLLSMELFYADTVHTIPFDHNGKSAFIRLPDQKSLLLASPFAKGTEYGYYSVSDEELEFLLSQVSREKNELRRYVWHMVLWENFLNAGIHPETYFQTLFQCVNSEGNEIILDYVLSRASDVFWRFLLETEGREAGIEMEEALLDRLEREKSITLKRSLWNGYKSMISSSTGREHLYMIWSDGVNPYGLPSSEAEFIDLASRLCILEHNRWEEILQMQMERIQNPDRLRRFNFLSDALSNDPVYRHLFFERIKQAENRSQESWVQSGLAYLHHPLRKKDSERYLFETLELLSEIQRTGDIFFPGNVLNRSFNWYTSESAWQSVNTFLQRNQDYPSYLKQKILQETDLLSRSVAIQSKFKDRRILN